MAKEREKELSAPESSPPQLGFLWILVVIMFLGTGVVVYVKTRPETGSNDKAKATDDAPKGKKGPREWDQEAMESLFNQAESDYRKFLKAEKKEDRALRSRYYNQAKVRLDAFMEKLNKIPEDQVGDRELVSRAVNLLSDLSKKARTGD
ncbi:MAG: hypothetical protein P1V97_24110 [Planctomycetota bacterium]|nr:hypothetical protein [Planctomycetota bacterium]